MKFIIKDTSKVVVDAKERQVVSEITVEKEVHA